MEFFKFNRIFLKLSGKSFKIQIYNLWADINSIFHVKCGKAYFNARASRVKIFFCSLYTES